MKACLAWMRHRRKWLAVGAVILILPFSYPAFVLGYTWFHVAQSDLPGGRNGPLDAYRHTLASAVVAYTLDPRIVHGISRVMEFRKWPTHRMDRHNNYLGTVIASQVESFAELEPAVRRKVARGKVNARINHQATWLSKGWWKEGKMW